MARNAHRLDTTVPVRQPMPSPGYDEPEPHAAQREREAYHPEGWRQTPEERAEIQAPPDYPMPDDKEPILNEIPGESELKPLPVTVVDSPDPRETWYWEGTHYTVVTNRATHIVGRDNRRRRLQIHNNDASNNVFLMNTPNFDPLQDGYQLEPGRTLELLHNDHIWARSVANVQVSVAYEFSPHEAE